MRNPTRNIRPRHLILGTMPLATLVLSGVTGPAASAAERRPQATQVVMVKRGSATAGDSCTDWEINGWGDCGGFLKDCGKGGGHAHGLNNSGILPSVTYTCHPGREHRNGD